MLKTVLFTGTRAGSQTPKPQNPKTPSENILIELWQRREKFKRYVTWIVCKLNSKPIFHYSWSPCILRMNSASLSACVRIFGFFWPAVLWFFFFLACSAAGFGFNFSSSSRFFFFSSFWRFLSSFTFASSSISYGVFILYDLKKKFTMVLLKTESQSMHPVRDFASPGKGELSLYMAVILKESHSSHFSGIV